MPAAVKPLVGNSDGAACIVISCRATECKTWWRCENADGTRLFLGDAEPEQGDDDNERHLRAEEAARALTGHLSGGPDGSGPPGRQPGTATVPYPNDGRLDQTRYRYDRQNDR